ncbi:NAD(P)-binding protein [Bacillus solimangrovi]|nr:NAD(P)-binding protein [Bacillus solimangrovi]
MDNLYSAMLQLKGKSVVIVGGGKIATRKVGSIMETGASIIVISPTITNELKSLVESNQIVWESKSFESSDVKNAFMIIAATNDVDVNKMVYQSVNEHQLINIVDCPEKSNFIVPATVKRGKLILSVSTSGASPTLSRKIKRELLEQYDEYYEEYLLFLENCRRQIKDEFDNEKDRRFLLKNLVEPVYLQLTREEKNTLRNEKFEQMLRERRK